MPVVIHVEYRNATYYGLFEQYLRQGSGMIIQDDSTIIFAQWKNNTINGSYIYITDGLQAFGTMIGGFLDGYNVINVSDNRTSHGNGHGTRTIYGMFRNDKLNGKCIQIDDQMVTVGQWISHDLQQIIVNRPIHSRQVYDTLQQYYPGHIYTLEEFIIQFLKNAAISLQHQEESSRFEPAVTKFSGNVNFYGYAESNRSGRRFGLTMRDSEVLSVGEHQQSILEGIGRLYTGKNIEDGVFRSGRLSGIGVSYIMETGRYLIGEYNVQNSKMQKGMGFPKKQIRQIRKQFHLRSIYFYNDIVMLGLNNHFLMFIDHIFQPMFNKKNKLNQQNTPHKLSSYEPIHHKLHKYSTDNDYIEENSPIKSKLINEYNPKDYLNQSYFNQQQTANYQKDDIRTKYYEKYLQREDNQPYQQPYQQMKSRSTQRIRKSKINYNDLINKSRQQQREGQQRRQRTYTAWDQDRNNSGSRFEKVSRSKKDTNQLVRQLAEQQKKKRLDLHQIYRKEGLYQRK